MGLWAKIFLKQDYRTTGSMKYSGKELHANCQQEYYPYSDMRLQVVIVAVFEASGLEFDGCLGMGLPSCFHQMQLVPDYTIDQSTLHLQLEVVDGATMLSQKETTAGYLLG